MNLKNIQITSSNIWLVLITFLIAHQIVVGQNSTTDSYIVDAQINQIVEDLLNSLEYQEITIAVLPFEMTEGRSEARSLGEAAAILINQNLINHQNILVVERQRLNDIVEEIGLSQTGLTEDEIEVGHLLNVQFLIAGAVADLGNRFLLAARLVEIESGNIIQSSSVEIPSSSFLSISSDLVVIKKYPITAAFRSMILPGWGQFYNDKPQKGSFVLGLELLLAGSTISSYMLYKQSKSAYDRAEQRQIATDTYDEMEKYAQLNWISLGIMGGVWIYAIIDSYIDSRKQLKKP